MQVNPDAHAEYKKRHDEIFPELVTELKNHGSHHYSIFLDKERNLLFGYVEIEDEARWNAIAKTEACQKWWAFMKDIMPSNPDNSPISQELEQVFYLD
ncbi:L-rhamnose mutarotase [Mannheimia varigena USDA-ARS-USMARC-1296]|uniref:L-rhamnose mutarotase n=2 Tax=Pasteurellaceae TaxID=712 RepID=W0QFH4_9PAST|nr:L-rhamnose mutarotase [Mannheimia varigena USDA-ARS-USMARC-1296]